jgi:hypothetical protein
MPAAPSLRVLEVWSVSFGSGVPSSQDCEYPFGTAPKERWESDARTTVGALAPPLASSASGGLLSLDRLTGGAS